MAAFPLRPGSVSLPRSRRVSAPSIDLSGVRDFIVSLAPSTGLFLTVALATTFVASLVGQVSLERARREGISASGRAAVAENTRNDAEASLNATTGAFNVRSWARDHGFVEADAVAGSSTPKSKSNYVAPKTR
jgi:hypothetical protein